MVFVSHLQFIDNSNPILYKCYQEVFKEGFLGVSFFFILSGFILSVNYVQKINERQISNREFWVARIARIYPLHLFTMFLALPPSFDEIFVDMGLWLSRFFTHLFLVQSFVPNSDIYFSLNMPSWSISNEFFFYLMFPLLVVFYRLYHWGKWLLLLFVLCIPLAIWLMPVAYTHKLFYINPFFRIADFILGILLYYLFKKVQNQSWTSSISTCTWLEWLSIGFFVLLFVFHKQVPIQYRYSAYYWPAMLGIIFIFAFQVGFVSRLLSNSTMILLGEISFGFYMLHQLVIRYFQFLNDRLQIIQNQYMMAGIMLLITILGSYITYRWIELPSNKRIKAWYKNQLTKV